MAEGAEIGHAYLTILPSMRGFGRKVISGTGPDIDKAARSGGSRYGSVFAKSSLGPIRAIGGAALGFIAVDALKNVATAGLRTASNLEQAQIAFSTLLKSGKRARSFLSSLSSFAARTPFELPGLIDAARQLLGAGAAAKTVIPTLTAYGDAAGALGLQQDQFNHIMLATTQSMANGKIQAGDMLQITQAGLPIWKLLAESLGKPVAKVRELSSQGKLLTKNVLPKLQKQMEKDYGGAMARQSRTLGGLWSTLMDTFNIGVARVIKPLEPLMRHVIPSAASAMGSGLKKASRFMARDVVPGIKHVRDLFTHRLLPDGKALVGRARRFAKSIVDTVTKAFSGGGGGDWSALGKSIGSGISSALTDALRGALNLSGKIGSLFASVDWGSLGLKVGKTAVKFVTGFVIGFLANLTDMLGVIKDHWWQAILAALTVIPIGRAAGLLEKVITKIPILRVFAPLLRGVAKVGGLFERTVGRFFGKIGLFVFHSIERGLGLEAGATRAIFTRFFSNIITHIYVYADDFLKAGVRLLRGLGEGIGRGIEWVVRQAARAIKFLLRPFATAGKWLLDAGMDVIRGFINGIKSMAGELIGAIKSTITDHLPGFVKKALGISSPSRVFYEIGVNLMRGLHLGIHSNAAQVLKELDNLVRRVKDRIKALTSAKNQMAASIASNIVSGASFSNAPSSNLTALISFKRHEAAQSRRFRRDLAILRKRGLSRAEIADLASQGLDALPTVESLSHATNGQLHQIDALDRTIKANAKAVGDRSAAYVYNPQIAGLHDVLVGLRHDVRQVGRDVEDANRRVHRHRALKAKTRTGGRK